MSNDPDEIKKELFLSEIKKIQEKFGINDYDAFPRWVCKKILGIDDQGKISNAVAIGQSSDYEIDIFSHLDEGDIEDQEIVMGQAKFSGTLNRVFEDKDFQRLMKGIERLENPPNDANAIFKDRAGQFKQLGGRESPIRKTIVIAVAGKINNQVKAQLEDPVWIASNLSVIQSAGRMDILIIDAEKILNSISTGITPALTIKFERTIIPKKDLTTGKNSIFGYLKANELIKILDKHGDTLFLENPRRFLGKSKPPSKAMLKTLQDPEKRKQFWKLNNGLTATCIKFKEDDNNSNWFRIENMKIVNGQQTSRILQDNKGLVDDSVEVRIGIYETLDNEERNDLSKATNTQNPIKPADIVSQKKEQEDLRMQCKHYYRQEFWYEQQTALFLFHLGHLTYYAIVLIIET